MAEEENESVTHEESAQPQQSAKETLEGSQAEASSQSAQSDKDYNFEQLRLRAEEAQRAADEERRKREELERRYKEREVQAESKEDEFSDDDLLEGKHLKKYGSKIEKKIQQLEQQYQMSAAEAKLHAKFPDFNSVVTQANIEKLQKQEPEVAQTLLSGSDLYAKGVSAYKYLKSMGYVPKEKTEEAKKLKENAEKPRMSSNAPTGNRPITEAYNFSQMNPKERSKFHQEALERLRKSLAG